MSRKVCLKLVFYFCVFRTHPAHPTSCIFSHLKRNRRGRGTVYSKGRRAVPQGCRLPSSLAAHRYCFRRALAAVLSLCVLFGWLTDAVFISEAAR